jgi:serine/threonine-protein kinase
MTSSRWDRLEELLERAAAMPAAERAAFVERETADDPALRAELASLLEASEGAGDYLGRLREQVLGSELGGVLRDPAAMGAGHDPWIGRTVSHYQILDRIGGGGMGVVYRARDVTLDREVALKFIAPELRRDSEARRRFLREAQAASQLDHPNICTVHEIAETEDGRLFIVMAAYDGETLRSRIDRGAVPEPDALDLAVQIARALAAAHERGIVHRDVKPENVFITREGVVKLLDFGLARTADRWMSGAGGVAGTVAYMSPEQADGTPVDARSDVWALGVILFEMLAGVRPFSAEDARETIRLILTAEPDLGAARADLAPGTIEVVQRALSRDPAGRLASGSEILASLQRAGPVPAGVGPALRAWAWPIGAVASALLVVVAVAGLLIRESPAPDSVIPTHPDSAPHVLWVDDDPANNRFIIEQFNARGVRVTTVLNTAQALERYHPDTHQLVISDMGRFEGPEGAYVARAGLDLLEALRARHEALPLVFCTSARAVAEFRDQALSAGARDIVTECEVILRLLGIEPRSPG